MEKDMITKIQSTNKNLGFKNNSNVENKDLVEYKRNFLKDQFEKEYQKDLKSFNRGNIGGALFALGWAAYDGIRGHKTGAIGMLVITAVLYPLMFLFKPKKEKYDIKLQEELNKSNI